METRSIADIEGPWVEQSFSSGLILRCKENWHVPVSELSNYALATFVRQRFGLIICIPEANRRIAIGYTDDTEMYDEELEHAVKECR
ncbi:hypothetical protein M2404_004039 [Rheinheimera pacifica]|uniref:hypothetical protein n=1 Tax=Rheinheimera pacifica TaxID=173990 RepID=UPI0021681F5B|nr:hypothetical protein [Rheinheimera pacifica]MCS4309662.1 hypothetical protein [Rheinheimera pacifica]